MLKAEPLRTFPFGYGLQAELMLLPDCDVLGNIFCCWRQYLGTIPWPYGGRLGEIFQNYWVPPPPAFILVQLQENLSSFLNCLNRFVVKVYSITIPNWELSFTVSVMPKLDRLDKLCSSYSVVSGQGKK